ncbi:MAG: hypothetical protein Q4A71_04165 [Actinomycetaceae bacterium]|nr:hypothetical protein [Actinomycetaceae bacterium]
MSDFRRVPTSDKFRQLQNAPRSLENDALMSSAVGSHVSSVASALGQTTEIAAFLVADTGKVRTVVSDRPAPPPFWQDDLAGLDTDYARNLVVLGVQDQVFASEVEALAVSLFEGAGWEGPGRISFGRGTLVGPYLLSPAERQALDLPEFTARVFLLEIVPQVGAVMPEPMRGVDPYMDAFTRGLPEGDYLVAVDGLRKVGRRLAGLVRVPDSGYLYVPEPDRVGAQTVYTKQWLSPQQLQNLWAGVFDQFELLGQTDDQYSLRAPAGNRSNVQIIVETADHVPLALRWESWIHEGVFSYQLLWLPEDVAAANEDPVRRSVRIERSRVLGQISQAANLLVANFQARVLDEDGFLL